MAVDEQKLTKTQKEMIKEFQCPGCISGSDLKCGNFQLEEWAEEKTVLVTISDTGMGMGTAVQRNVFDPFFTTKDSGTGLGLPITHKVITEHGGQIDAVSKKEQGTQFTIHLPIHEKISDLTISSPGLQ